MEFQTGKVRAITLSGRRGEGLYTFCSEEDYDFLIKFKWHLCGRYVRSMKLGLMHRVIAERIGLNLEGKEIDHRDRNPLNNLRSNLRSATREENMRNKSIQSNNSSGYPGVSFHKRDNKWYGRIIISGKEKYLGCYLTFEEAKEARIAAEKEYFGEFRPIHKSS